MEEDFSVNSSSSYYLNNLPFIATNSSSSHASSLSFHHPTAAWLSPYTFSAPAENPHPSLDLNHVKDVVEYEQGSVPSKEHLFEKPLTPSDVGKLNRLVIPKQYAERYFPLAGESVEKGLLLSFEDELGKCWKFRYSYWNSSQSYVLTKGWSRYVKEKQLEAGDVVMFQRHRLDGERLFIGWRRRGDNSVCCVGAGEKNTSSDTNTTTSTPLINGCKSRHNNTQNDTTNTTYRISEALQCGVGVGGDYPHAGTLARDQSSVIGLSRKVRLFGVNLECHVGDQSEPSTPDGSSMSSQGLMQQFYSSQLAYSYNSSSSPSHMVGYNY